MIDALDNKRPFSSFFIFVTFSARSLSSVLMSVLERCSIRRREAPRRRTQLCAALASPDFLTSRSLDPRLQTNTLPRKTLPFFELLLGKKYILEWQKETKIEHYCPTNVPSTTKKVRSYFSQAINIASQLRDIDLPLQFCHLFLMGRVSSSINGSNFGRQYNKESCSQLFPLSWRCWLGDAWMTCLRAGEDYCHKACGASARGGGRGCRSFRQIHSTVNNQKAEQSLQKKRCCLKCERTPPPPPPPRLRYGGGNQPPSSRVFLQEAKLAEVGNEL